MRGTGRAFGTARDRARQLRKPLVAKRKWLCQLYRPHSEVPRRLSPSLGIGLYHSICRTPDLESFAPAIHEHLLPL